VNEGTAEAVRKGLRDPVLILGGSGFIGTCLADLLTRHSLSVRIADVKVSEKFPQLCLNCDVTDLSSVKQAVTGSGAIVNLAAEHRDDVSPRSRYRDVNVQGAVHVCEAATLAGVKKIIFTSSVAVYGFQPHAVSEDGPFEPFNEYGKTKLQAEAVYIAWAEEDPSRSLVIVRPTVVFGEGNRGNVYNLLNQIAKGRFLMVGAGTNVKSMAYVGNVAAFLAHALSLGSGIHISNYVDGPDLSTRELVQYIHHCLATPTRIRSVPKFAAIGVGYGFDLVARLSGRRFSISAIRVKKFCETTRVRADRVEAWGFTPPYSLSDGLARTIASEFGNPSS